MTSAIITPILLPVLADAAPTANPTTITINPPKNKRVFPSPSIIASINPIGYHYAHHQHIYLTMQPIGYVECIYYPTGLNFCIR